MKRISSACDIYTELMGRVYTSIVYSDFFEDDMSYSMWNNVQRDIKLELGKSHNDFKMLSSAIRSNNMDLFVKRFLRRNENGTVVNIASELDTLKYRNDNGKANWVNIDSLAKLEVREQYLKQEDRERNLAYGIFDYEWINEVKKIGDEPVLVLALGIFKYFKEEQIVEFIDKLREFKNVELVFDVFSSRGMQITNKYIQKFDKEEEMISFYIDKFELFINNLKERPSKYKQYKYYSCVRKNKRLKSSNLLRFNTSDKFNMLKLIDIKY